MRFKLILCSVKVDITDNIIDAAKEAGATGSTIIPGRGTGAPEAKTFFGLSLEAQTDIILLLVEEHLILKILDTIKEAGEFHKPGTGIAYVIPVEHVVGMESQIERFKEEVRENYF
ncbi:MAG: P-II family nitrogen regulator [Desulfuromusa sp.]|nr:P-II family nitrogen regulator [Desulfuromusa sp.]